MSFQRFEELPVWQAAIQLAVKTYESTAREEFRGQGSLRDQIERASVSVSNNIAEGFERGTNQELISFLYIARGSVGEVRSMLCLLENLSGFRNLKFEISNLKSRAEDIARQLRAWAGHLQDSPIKGQRYLTERDRQAAKRARSQEEFQKHLRQVIEERPAREPDEGGPP